MQIDWQSTQHRLQSKLEDIFKNRIEINSNTNKYSSDRSIFVSLLYHFWFILHSKYALCFKNAKWNTEINEKLIIWFHLYPCIFQANRIKLWCIIAAIFLTSPQIRYSSFYRCYSQYIPTVFFHTAHNWKSNTNRSTRQMRWFESVSFK